MKLVFDTIRDPDNWYLDLRPATGDGYVFQHVPACADPRELPDFPVRFEGLVDDARERHPDLFEGLPFEAFVAIVRANPKAVPLYRLTENRQVVPYLPAEV